MYENQTYNEILERMLNRVPNDIDKREGSVIYNALAPAAAELAQAYIELDINLNLAFAETSSGEYLEMRTAELGVYRNEATKAQRRGLFYDGSDVLMDVPLGSRYSISSINYVVIAKEGTGQFILECEEAGVIGNQEYGDLLPISTIDGLSKAELTDIIIPGTDEEGDDSLLSRYQEQLDQPSTSNNKAQLKQWAQEVDGVGDVKVFPLWDGDNTVKVVIVDSNITPASPELVSNVQDYIDPNSTGLGEGQAAIGLFCTVQSATEKNIDISATLVLDDGKALTDAQTEIEQGLADYLKSIAFKETSDGQPELVRYTEIGSLILDAESVIDYSGLIVNGDTSNVSLAEEEIPKRGTVTLSE